MKMPRGLIFVMTFISLLQTARDEERRRLITTGSLFQEMIDLARLAELPDPPFRMVQFSSFDRRSRLPGGPDWFANADGFGEEPVPNFEKVLREPDESGEGEYLIADLDGPGALVRVWTAGMSGKVRVYVDGSETPLHDGAAEDFFRRPYDRFPQMRRVDQERFRKTIYERDASYAPLPFAKHLRIVWQGKIKDIHFYHAQIRLYPAATRVISFSADDIDRYSEIIDRVTLVLSDPDAYLTSRSSEQEKPFSVILGPSEKKEVFSAKRPGALERLVLRVEAEDLDRALRQTVLQIVCDDHPRGQVQSPVGDFFGAAPGVNPCQSLPFTVQPDGTMTCRFVMPFEGSLRIQLENQGGQEVSVKGSALLMPYEWGKNSLHFRARWRVGHDLIASNVDVQDLTFLSARGSGVYVGTAAFVLNPSPIPTSWGNWWGEGDEKVFVDDDALPSLFGTGSEDYFNYSWSSPDIFFFPYCGQPRNDGPGNRGFVTNFRWHILDSIPFSKSIFFYLELCSHEPTPGLSYARIGYHYARPGITDDHAAIMPDDLRPLRLPKGWMPAARFGARNSVFFQTEDILSDSRNTRLEDGDLWAGGKLVVWTPENTGDRLDLKVKVDSPGFVKIHATAALTPRSGKFAVFLDDRHLPTEEGGETIDLGQPQRTLLRDFPLRTLELSEGGHTLTIEFRGTTGLVESPQIGLDFFWVQRVER